MPSEAAVRFVLELLGLPWLSCSEHDWFFSDWADEPERTFGGRLHDLMTARTVERRWAEQRAVLS